MILLLRVIYHTIPETLALWHCLRMYLSLNIIFRKNQTVRYLLILKTSFIYNGTRICRIFANIVEIYLNKLISYSSQWLLKEVSQHNSDKWR